MFKFYLNRKVRHPSISVKSKNKKKWRNLPITHSKPSKDTFIVIEDPHPKAKKAQKPMFERMRGKTNTSLKDIGLGSIRLL